MPCEYHGVTPRLVVTDARKAVAFLRTVFGATGEVTEDGPAEVRIGDSLVMVSSAGERDLFPAFLSVYVDDADDTYQRAMEAGAVTLAEPQDTPYGDRRATVREPFDNVFQIAHRLAPNHAMGHVRGDANGQDDVAVAPALRLTYP